MKDNMIYPEILWTRRWLRHKFQILVCARDITENVVDQTSFFRTLDNLELDTGLLCKLIQNGYAADSCELGTNVSGTVQFEERHEDVINIGTEVVGQVNRSHVLVYLNHCG